MSVGEHRRIRLFERWVQTWGQEDAETMLELHPPAGSDPATSDDVAGLHARIDQDVAGLHARIDQDVAGLHARIDQDVAGLHARIDRTDARVDAGFAALRTEFDLKLEATKSELIGVFRAEIQRAVVTQTRITVFSMVTAFAAVSALALGLG